MWATVLILAMALSLEPARPALVPLMLVRPRPALQLFALFCGNFITAFSAGLLVLFVFHRTPLGGDRSTGAKILLTIGIVAVVVAAVMALSAGRGGAPAAETGDPPKNRPVDRLTERARAVLRKGNSPWISWVIGLGIGLPSIDYLAALVVIGSAGASAASQVGALVMFLIVGNAVILVPLITCLLAPERTARAVERFRAWVQTRSRRQLALILGSVGVLQILIGLNGLRL